MNNPHIYMEKARGSIPCNAGYWYSKKTISILLMALMLVTFAISLVIPPFQSPDEFNHMKRAYLLSKGDISKGDVFIDSYTPVSGGNIDTGLLEFMYIFEKLPFATEAKMSRADMMNGSKILWSGERKSSGLANTLFYFPLPYLPQALAMLMGEVTGLSVSHSYYLARFISLVAAFGLLWLAFAVYPTPLIILALFTTPMTLFQMGSASLDAVAFALTALAAALYTRAVDRSYEFSHLMHAALAIVLFAVATTRINLLPVVLLLLVLYYLRREKAYFYSFLLTASLSLTWIIHGLVSIKGSAPAREHTTAWLVSYYIDNPLVFFDIIYRTITNNEILWNYYRGFIGVLGWLDSPLPENLYIFYAVLLAVFIFISLQRTCYCFKSAGIMALLLIGISSAALLFPILLLAWTPHPAEFIQGIQGRYFTPCLILIAYAVLNRNLSAIKKKFGMAITMTLLLTSVWFTVQNLLSRYWLQDAKIINSSLISSVGLFDPNLSRFHLRDSKNPNQPIVFEFGEPNAGWLPITGDWDGDGLATIGFYIPTTATFLLRNRHAGGDADVQFKFGRADASWIPVTGDWNGDGITTVGLYDPSEGNFYLHNTHIGGSDDLAYSFGPKKAGWQPIVGDWDGDGIETVGLFDPKTSSFLLNNRHQNDTGIQFIFGSHLSKGLIVITGDWDGDGKDSFGFFYPKENRFVLKNSLTPGDFTEVDFNFGSPDTQWLPLTGHWTP